jgi:SsrA-binding protein
VATPPTPQNSTIATNRKARYDYTILDTIEAGVVLHGSEVKSMRLGQMQVADSFARVLNGEVWLDGVHIAPYQFAHGVGAHDPGRPRKLLLHAGEIAKLAARIQQDRVALIPLRFYFKGGRVKVELGVATGRRKADKRQAMAARDTQREMARALGRQAKGRES